MEENIKVFVQQFCRNGIKIAKLSLLESKPGLLYAIFWVSSCEYTTFRVYDCFSEYTTFRVYDCFSEYTTFRVYDCVSIFADIMWSREYELKIQ